MWLVYALLVFSFEASENNNADYIPDGSSSVYQLDGRVLTRELLASLLISEDEDLRQLTREQIPTTEDGKLKPVGISFDSDIILFRLKEKGLEYSGMLFNLWDQRLFEKNVPKFLGSSSASASTEKVGLILFQLEGDRSKAQLRNQAKKMLARKTNFAAKHPLEENQSLISVWYQEGDNLITDVGISVQNNQLLIDGNFETNKKLSDQNLATYEGGFHVHSMWFPESISLRIESLLKSVDVDIPPIKQFSLNYFGTTIVTEPSIAGLPKFIGAIEFEKDIEVDSVFKNFELISFDSLTNTSTYTVLEHNYEVTKKNPKTIELRSTRGISVKPVHKGAIAEISGSPKYLMKLDGDDFIRRILSATSEYSSINSFAKEIRKLDIKMMPVSGNKYRIRGKIVLRDEKWPLNELLKFLIRSKLLQ